MAAQVVLCFASALLVQTIAGQIANTGVVEVNNLSINGNGINLSNNDNSISGYGSVISGSTNAGILDFASSGVTGVNLGNGIGFSNSGSGYSYGGNYDSGYGGNYGSTNGLLSADSVDFANSGVSGISLGNSISLSNNGGGYSNGGNYGSGYSLISANTLDLNNLGVASNGINIANRAGYGNLGLGNGIGYGNNGLASSGYGSSCGSVNNYGNAAQSLSNGISFGNGYGANSYGGAFSVSSTSPLSPTGLTVVSDNAINGDINVNGVLPFLSAVTLDGLVASGGSAGVQYRCGNGNIGIISENTVAGNTGNGASIGYGTGVGNGLGSGFGLAAPLGGAIVVGPVANNYGSSCGCKY